MRHTDIRYLVMVTSTSPNSGESEDDPFLNAFKYSLHDDDHHDTSTQDVSLADPKSLPMQKRRRVGRACDECRRKKIKCDGKQPCTHCTGYNYGTPSFVVFNSEEKKFACGLTAIM